MKQVLGFLGFFFLTINFCEAQSHALKEPQLTLQKYRQSNSDKDKAEFLLKLGSYYLLKPGEDSFDLDSAFLRANQAKILSERIQYLKGRDEALSLIGNIYVESKNYPQVDKMLKGKLNDTVRLKIMFELVKNRYEASGRTKAMEDSILVFGEKVLKLCQLTQSNNIALECMLLMYSCSPDERNTAKVKTMLSQKFNDVRSKNDVAIEIKNYFNFYFFTSRERSNSKFIQFFRDRMIEDFDKLDPKQKEALTFDIVERLTEMAIMYFNAGHSDAAIEELHKAIQVGENAKVIDIHPYEALVHVFLSKGMTNLALSNALICRRILEKQKTVEVDKSVYSTIGMVYIELEKFEESIVFFDKAIEISLKKKIAIDYFILNYHTSAYLGLNRAKEELNFLFKNKATFSTNELSQCIYMKNLGDCYLALNQYKKAEVYYLKCKKVFSTYSSNSSSIRFCSSLGKLYTRMKRYKEARTYLNTLISEQNRKIIPIKVQRDVNLLLFQIDSSTRNYVGAISHLQTYKALNDSIFNDTKQKQIEELQIQYELGRKDKELILRNQNIALLTNKSLIQEANLKNANLLRNIIIISALFLLGALYIFYLLKQRHNTRLQTQQLEINQRNEQLNVLVIAQQKLVSEKEWLVKEIHHRVKNNLQIVVSLLNTQAAHLSDGDALAAIQESRHRMQVISLLHQKLYQVENDGLIDIQVYIKEVISYLKDSFEGINHLFFEVQIAPISLDISQAVPVGLILNEAITNAIKYAFPKNKNGLISVSLERTEDENLRLIIKDNGIGLLKGFNPSQSKSLGMQLMQTLSEQLDGNVWIESQNGTIIKVIFKPHLAEKAAYHTNSLNATLNYDQQNTHR